MSAAHPTEFTAKDFKRDYPALYAQLRLSFMAVGAEAERARIKSVLAQALPGDEALVHQLAFDGVTTGLEAARKVLMRRVRLKPSQASNAPPAKASAEPNAGGAGDDAISEGRPS